LLDEERSKGSSNCGHGFADYTVYDIDYEEIGKVDDVFVDENDQPRYICVKMGFLDIRLALIPIELIRVNDRRGLVEVAASKDVVKERPTFSDDWELTPEFEQRVLDYYEVENHAVETAQAHTRREAYDAPYSHELSSEEVNLRSGECAEAAHEHFGEDHTEEVRGIIRAHSSDDPNDEDELRVPRVEEELRVGTIEREAGSSVRVRKRARTEREQVRVPEKRQEVRVERVPVEEDSGICEPEIVDDGDEIRVPVVEEEIVVERRPVVREVLRIRKEVVEEEEVIEEYVRKEEIDVEDGTERNLRKNNVNGGVETLHRLPQKTPVETNPEERPKKQGKMDRKASLLAEDKRQRANKTKAPKVNRRGMPLESYDDLTVEEAKKKIGGLSEEELKKIRSYEKRHKNRKTLVEQLDRKIKDAS
jgi:uncharacterized protein (TIGR02271 family)